MAARSIVLIGALALLAGACTAGPRAPSVRAPVDQRFQAPARPTPKSVPGTESPPTRPGQPPVLSPEVVDSDRVKQEVNRRLGHAARIVDGIDASKLAKDQQELYVSLLDFLSKARAALVSEDLAGAQVLSEKASKLADALASSR
jgi:hypothetical protein